MTREEAIKILEQFKKCLADVVFDEKGSEAWQMAIQALSQEPTDAVSREAVKEILTKYHLGESRIAEELNELPSVTQKSGKWIFLDECANSGYYCSECQKKLVKEGWSQTVKKINYCPNCGAKMEGADK